MNKNKIKVIFFTYKRAIFLDAAINSLIKKFKSISYPIIVIYHSHEDHKKSYNILKKKYKNKIIFYERKKQNLLSKFNLIFNPINILFLLRWPNMFKEWNSFKNILENTLKKIKNDNIMFCPDDIFFYKNVNITKNILKIINQDPDKKFIRLAYGKNLSKNFSKKVKTKIYKVDNQIFFEWSHKDVPLDINLKQSIINSMRYNFHIDAGIYNRKSLIKLLSKTLYHNPISLEANIVKISKIYNFFEKTISPIERVAATYQLTTVQNDNIYRNKKRIQTDSMLLNRLYLKGFNLIHKIKSRMKNDHNVYPKEVYLVNNKKKIFNLKKIIKVLKKDNL